MRNYIRKLSGLLALGALGLSSSVQAVTIDVGAYAGNYRIGGSGVSSGSESLALGAGSYTFDDGASVGGVFGSSYFGFNVNASGQVSCSTVAASCTGSTISLNSVGVMIDAGGYTGRYILSSLYPQALRGNHAVTLIPGLAYTLDDGTEIGASAFAFVLDAVGNITSLSPAATGNGTVLKLNSTAVTLKPEGATGSYLLSSVAPTSNTGTQTFSLMPGLAYGVETHLAGATVDIVFQVGSGGTVTTSSALARADGSVLTFITTAAAPVPVPPSTVLLGAGALAWMAGARRRRGRIASCATTPGPA